MSIQIPSKQLDPRLVVGGTVHNHSIFTDGCISVSLLTVAPMTLIRPHQHVNDCELYFDISSEKSTFCERGGMHGFVNSTRETRFIISIKSRKPISEEELKRYIPP